MARAIVDVTVREEQNTRLGFSMRWKHSDMRRTMSSEMPRRNPSKLPVRQRMILPERQRSIQTKGIRPRRRNRVKSMQSQMQSPKCSIAILHPKPLKIIVSRAVGSMSWVLDNRAEVSTNRKN